MPTIVNQKTGFVANASDADWNNKVYDQSVWSVQGATPAATPAPVAPSPTSTISTAEMSKPAASSVVSQAQKMGTFVNYNPQTGAVDVKSRKAGAINDYDPQSQLLETRIPNVAELQSGKYVVTNKVGNDYYGVLKPQTPQSAQTPVNTATQTATPTGGTPAGAANTPAAQAATIWEQYQQGLAGPNQQVTAAQTAANAIKGELDQMRNDTDFQNVLQTAATGKIQKEQLGLKNEYNQNVGVIEDKPIPMGDINNQISRLSEVTNRAIGALGDQLSGMNIEKAITDATNVYKYNSKLIEYQVAQGNVAAAQSMVQQTAQDFWQFQNLQIQLLERQDKLDAQAAQVLYQQAEMDLGLAESGYIQLTPATASQYGPDRVWTNPVTGKQYLKPDPGAMDQPLSISEAAQLGVPYGTTRGQAAAMNITPGGTDKPLTTQVGDTLLQYNQATGQWTPVFNGATTNPGKIVNINGTDYLQKPDGTLVEPDIPGGTNLDTKLMKTNDVLASIDLLLNDAEGISDAVGPISSRLPTLEGSTSDFEVNFDNLVAKIALENLYLLKGPMSDKDIEFIRDASAGLRLKMSEEGFKKKLTDIRAKFELAKQKAEEQIKTTVKDREYYKKLFPQASYEEIDALMQQSGKTSVGGDTNQAVSKALNTTDGTKGGQCGRFVNKYTGLGLGDSYQSKLAKMDPTIKKPEPGMVFVMPYKDTGHTGFIVRVEGNYAVVKDSNWYNKTAPETVVTHRIPLSSMTGFARVNNYA